MTIQDPVNGTQRSFNDLCAATGGRPRRRDVQILLRESGQRLNEIGRAEIEESLAYLPAANPWHVCFAVAMCWGHLARYDLNFVSAAVRLITDWNDDDLDVVCQYPLERGPGPIRASLLGGRAMFERVGGDWDHFPNALAGYRRLQDHWLAIVTGGDRPAYIGAWNATALFMVALFADPANARQLVTPTVYLPPGGPIGTALSILHGHGGLVRRPNFAPEDELPIDFVVIAECNELFASLLPGLNDWSLIDVHSGLYMLGTRHPGSDGWF